MSFAKIYELLKNKLKLTLASFLLAAMITSPAMAANPQNPQNGSVGLEATVSGPPPQTAPTVTVPSNGQVFGNQPITVAGICINGLLVEVFDNNVFVGSTVCKSNSFTLQVGLFSGVNALVSRQYDGLNQPSPSSATVKVTYNPPSTPAFIGQLLSLTTSYAERGINPGQQLVWPINIAGGTPPYAISIDWGDNTKPQLVSEAFSGPVDLAHTYQTAGTYSVSIQATDKNGETAFLQVVAVVNGPVSSQTSSSSSTGSTRTVTKVIWWPAVVLLPLLVVAFWMGGKHALLNLQKNLEKSDQNL